jgi:NADH-quinone oxidoreductase subunit M
MFFGPVNEKNATLPDINARELFTLIPLALLVIFLGIWPHPVLDLMNTSMTYLGELVRQSGSLL